MLLLRQNDITGNAHYYITLNKGDFARLSAVFNFKFIDLLKSLFNSMILPNLKTKYFLFICEMSIAFAFFASSIRSYKCYSKKRIFPQMLNIHSSCCSYKCIVVKSWQTLFKKKKNKSFIFSVIVVQERKFPMCWATKLIVADRLSA